MSKKKEVAELPQLEGEDWVQWLERQSKAYLVQMILDAHVRESNYQDEIRHLKKHQIPNSIGIDTYRDHYIQLCLSSGESDAEIAKKVGVSARTVRGFRNKLGDKKSRGRPKKVV